MEVDFVILFSGVVGGKFARIQSWNSDVHRMWSRFQALMIELLGCKKHTDRYVRELKREQEDITVPLINYRFLHTREVLEIDQVTKGFETCPVNYQVHVASKKNSSIQELIRKLA